MTLNNTKSNNRGFTLVELLIVIVVIAILAAISLVAYNGIQDRSRTTTSAAAASTVATKAEAANTIANEYPATVSGTGTNTFASQKDSDLTGSGVVLAGVTKGNAPSDASTVSYQLCGKTGARITYYDYIKKDIVVRHLGDATAATTCSTALAASKL